MEHFIDRKTLEELERLKDVKRFLDSIAVIRNQLSIPSGGIEDSHAGVNFYISHQKKIAKAVKRTLERFELGENMEFPVRIYLLMGEHWKGQPTNELRPYGCSLDAVMGKPKIVIHPGAKLHDIYRYLRDMWPVIDLLLQTAGKKKRVYINKKRTRNRKVYDLYRAGVIKYDGHFDLVKTHAYLNNHDITSDSEIADAFSKIGIIVPRGQSARKKIILNLRKLKS